LVEEHLRTLDQQVSEKWDPKGPEKTLGETASAFWAASSFRVRCWHNVGALLPYCCARRGCDKPSGHLRKRVLRWGTVWGTIVPKHDVFDPKKRLTGRAKLLISEQQAPRLSKFGTVVPILVQAHPKAPKAL
jgi:hypothetical protein